MRYFVVLKRIMTYYASDSSWVLFEYIILFKMYARAIYTEKIQKKGDNKLESVRTYYGGNYIDDKDLEESDVRNRIELEYYTTKTYGNKLNEEVEMYGIEIVKKEYKDEGINIEFRNRGNICNNLDKINTIVDTLKRCKVTPIGLDDVIDDIDI